MDQRSSALDTGAHVPIPQQQSFQLRSALALALSAIALVALVGGASAQERGTKAEQDACTPDVFRLCSAYIPSETSIVACLQSNKRNLSQACYSVFFPRSAKRDLDMTPTGSIGTAKAHGRKAVYMRHRVSASHKARPTH